MAIWAAAVQPCVAQNPGPLVIVGGGLRADNDAVWRAIVTASGGEGARIGVLPQASSEPYGQAALAVEALNARGAAAFSAPSDADAPLVAAADGLYFTGGAQGRLMDALAGGPLLAAVRERHAAGVAIAGSSAGAAVMSQAMFRDPDDAATLMLRGVRPGIDMSDGLGLLDRRWLVDQHFLKRDRQHRIFAGLCAAQRSRALGVDEDTAVVIQGMSGAVVGKSGVVVLTDARMGACAPFARGRAKLAILHAGDRFDLRSGRVVLAPPSRGDAVRAPDSLFASQAAAVAMGKVAKGESLLPAADGAVWRFIVTPSRATRWSRSSAGVSVSGLRLTVVHETKKAGVAAGLPRSPD